MRVFFDTEFTGLTQNAQLVSIGLISEDGRTFYAESNAAQLTELSAWHQEHVLPGLRFNEYSSMPKLDLEHHAMKGGLGHIAAALASWLAQWEQVELWSDCLAYDWVLFCGLWGGALNLPKHISYIPFDLSTMLKLVGEDPDVAREAFAGLTDASQKHNALWDAKVIKACYEQCRRLFEAGSVAWPPLW